MRSQSPQTPVPERASSPVSTGDGTVGAAATRPSAFGPLLVAIVMTLIFLILPTLQTDIDLNGDVSLAAVLSYAHAHHWQFGRDLVFTYGPLGYLTFFYYSVDTIWQQFATALVFSFVVATGLAFLAWRLRPVWRWLLLALFAFAVSNLETRTDVVFDTGLFCWALLCYTETGGRQTASLTVMVLLAAFAGLAKVSYIIPAVVIVTAIAADLFLCGRRRAGLGVLAGYVAASMAGWSLAGQQLSNLVPFITGTFAVVRAYNQALGWEGVLFVLQIGLLLAALALPMILLRAFAAFSSASAGVDAGQKKHGRGSLCLRRLILCCWLLLITFVVWKHSFVRADFMHGGYFLAFVPVLWLGLEALPDQRRAVAHWAFGLGTVLCVIAMVTLQWYFLPAFPGSLGQPVRTARYDLGCLLRPGHYRQVIDAGAASMRQAAQLPQCAKLIGRSTVDDFGFNQIYLLFNHLNFRCAPVFQSYAVCDPALAKLNESFYMSASAPEYVLFGLTTVDRKFPPLDDSHLLRDLLINYQPVAAEKQFLLLKSHGREQPRLTLLHEGYVQPGEPINLAPYQQSNLWLEIDLEPNLAGRVRQMLYRAPVVRLAAWREPGKGLLNRQRAPASNLAAGFLASPMIRKTQDVQDLFNGTPVVRPGAYTVELPPGDERWWIHPIAYRIYKIENPLGNSRNLNLSLDRNPEGVLKAAVWACGQD